MAVMQNSLIFGDVNSADYGIYISGEGVFNAPKRDVEMISIPGRNGTFALDKGRFENITVTYPAITFEPNDYETFARNLSDFRNAICSLRGYQRLTDTFHPEEYRMGTYISGLEVKPIKHNTASQFDIVFDCKPQRWLTSGEDAVTMGEWGETETASGSIATFEGDEATGIKSLVADIEPIQSGSGTPSPDNVRPISGYDSVETSVAKKNIFDKSAITSGYLVGHGTGELAQNANYGASDYIPIKAGHTYTYSGTGTDTFNYWYSTFYDANKQVSAEIPPSTKSFTVPDGVCFLRTTVVLAKLDTAQLEQGTTTTDYEPYNGNTYTTNLSSTRYGGTLDVVSGVLTVTHKLVSISDVSWTYDSAYTRFYHQFSDATEGVTRITKATSSCFESITDGRALSSVPNNAIYFGGGNRTIYIKTTDYTTSSAFVSAFGSQTILYPLDTPTTVQLTAQQVSALVGTNNVWANSGDVSVEYGTAPNVLVNPTLFESSPLLEVEGYGNIEFNGYEIEIENAQAIGDVVLINAGSSSTHFPAGTYNNFNGNEAFLNAGDTITVPSITVTVVETVKPAVTIQSVARESSQDLLEATIRASSSRTIEVVIKSQPIEFQYGTAGTSVVGQASFGWTLYNTATAGSYTWTGQVCTISAEYDGDKTITFLSSGLHLPVNGWWDDSAKKIEYPSVVGTSTQDISLGHIYIDCDLGEAYKIESGGAISLNRYIDLGSDLPKLAIGANEITYDDTITELKVAPRWWKV